MPGDFFALSGFAMTQNFLIHNLGWIKQLLKGLYLSNIRMALNKPFHEAGKEVLFQKTNHRAALRFRQNSPARRMRDWKVSF
jgi:hypothetical protein